MAHHSPIRWYNPKLDDFEWRKGPQTDEEALQVLDGSPYAPRCTQAYQEAAKEAREEEGDAH